MTPIAPAHGLITVYPPEEISITLRTVRSYPWKVTLVTIYPSTLHILRISPPIINNIANINNSNKQGCTKLDNYARNTNYKDHLSHRLSVLGPFVANPEDIQTSLDSYMDKLCEAIHSAAHTAGCTGKQKYSPKPYWCPRLSQLRDKKRFWLRLWSSNGKPRSGQVYLCYKGVKKIFRKTFRQSITSITDKHYRKLQSLYNKRNMRTITASK